MTVRASWVWILLALAAAPQAKAQFQLLLLENGEERPAPAVYNLGSFYIDEAATARFRLRNTSSAPATLSLLTVAGFGFVLSSPPLPAGVAPQGSIDFSVNFRAAATGAYSASLSANGVSILLTTNVLPSLTYRLDPTLGPRQPGHFPGPLDFGRVLRGNSSQLRIRIQNETSQALTVPSIATEGDDFVLTSPVPSGQILQPGQGGEFTLAFIPRTSGARQGALVLGDRTYPLIGACLDPAPPKPLISIDLQPAASAQQGILIVRYDAPAQAAGTGIATISPAGPFDSAIVFANGGGRQVSFAFAPGDRQASFAFQTGTTAGALTFTVAIDGGGTDQQTIPIAAAAPVITGMQTVRSGGVLELRITGFDNTRSLGELAFSFYDAAGNAIAPGVIHADAAVEFARYFANSEAGVFMLRLAFPVSGDTSGIAWCEAALTNSAGTSKTPRTAF